MRTEKTQSIREARGENIALPPPTNYSDVTCRALHVALCAVQIHIAWHSGVMSGDVAMATLEQEISRASSPSTSMRCGFVPSPVTASD